MLRSGNQTEFLNGMKASYGLNDTELDLTYETFNEMIVYLNGGSQVYLKNKDIITGFYSPMAERICNPVTASFLKGDAISYNPFVTPSITNYVGPVADSTLTIFTGKPKVNVTSDEVGLRGDDTPVAGRIIAQNGIEWPNTLIDVFDSVENVRT
jgi:hypothetical protein